MTQTINQPQATSLPPVPVREPKSPPSSAPVAPVKIDDSFQVPWSTHVLSGLVARFPGLWKMLGNLETKVLREKLAQQIDRPIFIAGIARSGSTMLLEILAAHAQVATHQYRDFPFLHTPVWWSQAHDRNTHKAAPVERAHGDGIMVTPSSPEAMEETLWMSFFPAAHDTKSSQFLDRACSNPAFEDFYRDHLLKLLWVRDRSRYASKGNYNISRLPYLQKLFPDARFVVPIRHPLQHIASLMKQHRLFVEGETKYPRALAHMRCVGHFEFGLDRRPINVGNNEAIEEVELLWRHGEEVRGWARYWAHLYGWLADLLHRDDQMRAASRVVRYEDLCERPRVELISLLKHCELPDDAEVMSFESEIHAPTYYKPKFTDRELDIIAAETAATCAKFDYPSAEYIA